MAEISYGYHVNTWPDDAQTTAEQLRDDAEQNLAALAGRFSTLWVSDHLNPPHPWMDPSWPTLECWTTAVHFASMFPTYRVGQFMMNNSFRHPPLLAKMAATQQVLTRGRLIVGIGAGLSPAQNAAYGYDYPSHRVRIERLGETAQILRRMWREPQVTFHGKHYQVNEAFCAPNPSPPPTLLIGGGGERYTIPVAAQYADWYEPQARTPELYAHKMELFRQACERIGRDPSSVVRARSCGSIAVARTEAEAQKIADRSIFYQKSGPASTTIGTPEMIADYFRKFRDLGCDHFMISRFADVPSTESALLFAEEVMPLLT